MKPNPEESTEAAALRERAEEKIKQQRPGEGAPKVEVDAARLLQELQIHQVELEMQIQELLAARAELEKVLAQYTDLYDFAPTGYLTLDAGAVIRQVNLHGAQLLGVERSRLVGQRFDAFLAEADRRVFRDFLGKVFSGPAREFCEVLLSAGAAPRFVRIAGTPTDDGKECRAVLEDITERRHAAAELQQAHDTLEQRVQERTAEVLSANHEIEAFAYTVSHDLRTPLRAIDGYSQILVEECAADLNDEGRRLLGTVRSEAQRMGRMIDELLTFLHVGRQPMEPDPIDMQAMAAEAVADARRHAPERPLDIQLAALPPARGETVMLEQVWANLLGNAVKFSGHTAKPRIEIGGARENGETTYFVRDNGVGFDMAYAGKLFGVFQRLHGEEEFEGTGVGLAFVKRIIQHHGGRVWAEGAIDQGATVPLRAAGPHQKGNHPMSTDTFVEVLLVEDNPRDAEMAMRALKKRNLANNIVHVKDGQEALDFLFMEGKYAGRRNGMPRVVLLDLKLPKVDGIEVLRRIRADARIHTLPVVVMTSSREESDVVATYNLGVNSYIVKPVEFESFSEAVSRLGFYWVLLNQAPEAPVAR